MSKWPRLTAVIDLASHVMLGIHRCMGLCQDSPQFAPTMRDAARRQSIALVLGEKGCDSEENHRLCREELGADSTIIAVRRNTNGTRQWPKTPYQREMKPRARTWIGQQAETAIRVLTHNSMLCGNV